MITIQTTVNASPEKVWKFWNQPEHVMQWAFASPEWHAPKAENDLREGGKFSTTMAAKDGSMSFDFWGEYTLVRDNEAINYTMGDGRKVEITFAETPDGVVITERFEPESENSEEMQKGGWQAILNNFKTYVESN
ncbi:SRPBCC family protein [Flavobacterium olei]|uniref:SRPBCC family protein n=1 Tax=Flavobacterium olei TaxID=1886782 RepID=UPI00321B1F00